MSIDIAFIDLFQISGLTPPANGSDPTSGISYTSWALNEAAKISVVLPREFQPGSSIALKFTESTPGTSVNHKWSINTTLSSPYGSLIDSIVYESTTTSQITSPATANQIQATTVTIASNGAIDGGVARPGDILTFEIQRVAATANEDANEIKAIVINLILSVVASTYASCPGRVGAVLDRMLERFNDTGMGFASPIIALNYVNACQQDLAASGYWKTWRTITMVEDQETYDLFALHPDIIEIQAVRWTDTHVKLVPVPTMSRYSDIHKLAPSGIPQIWYSDGRLLYLTPVTDTAGDTIDIYITYTPADRDCSTNYDLLTPKAYDRMYANYALGMESMRQGMDDSRRANMAQSFMTMWQQEKMSLLSTINKRNRRIRSYRSV